MKHIKSLLALAVLAFLFLACSNESDHLDENFDLTVSIGTPIQDQVPNVAFDNSERGVYHGIIASINTLSRGKIWINIGNDSEYYAYVEMVGGDQVYFDHIPQSEFNSTNPSVYRFAGNSGGFVLDLTNFNTPIVSEATLNGQEFHIRVVKSRSSSMASSVTATFQEIDNPTFGGTWSLIADGTIVNPNGNDGEGITSLVITMNSVVYEDFTFDNYASMLCLGLPVVVPTINVNGIENYIISDNQTTPMAIGMTKWNLGYNALTSEYMNWMSCEVLADGEFSWTNDAGTDMKIGTITLD